MFGKFRKVSFLLVLIFLFTQSFFAQEYEYGEATEQARTQRDKDFKDALKSPLELDDFPYFKSLSYFPNNQNYKVTARFVRTPSEKKFEMPTMNGKSKTAVKYAELNFKLNGRELTLSVYQLEKVSQMEKYKNYLFVPFKDLTNGKETYGGGRYIDFEIPNGDTITIDFNRAYNPSCAYNKTKFSCPVPPRENHLKVRIEAGEKNFNHINKSVSTLQALFGSSDIMTKEAVDDFVKFLADKVPSWKLENGSYPSKASHSFSIVLKSSKGQTAIQVSDYKVRKNADEAFDGQVIANSNILKPLTKQSLTGIGERGYIWQNPSNTGYAHIYFQQGTLNATVFAPSPQLTKQFAQHLNTFLNKSKPIKPQTRFASFENNRVHYLDIGTGNTALIFVHGWTCNAEFWKSSYAAFKNIRTIAVDLPGHGESDKPQTNYTMEYFARSIEAVMKDANVTKAILVGHSMGTPVIRQFYRLYPEKTLGLVVVDGGLRPFGKKEDMEQFFAPLKANYKQAAPQFIDGMLAPIKDEKLKSEIRTSMLNTPEHAALSAMDGMNDERIWTNDKINVPVLAVMAKSPFWTNEYEQYVHSIVPNVDYQIWDGVSHFLMMEKPDEFNKTIAAFLVRNNFAK